LLLGRVQASCGVTWPYIWRTCTGQVGLPGSYTVRSGSGLVEARVFSGRGVRAVSWAVKPAILPPNGAVPASLRGPSWTVDAEATGPAGPSPTLVPST
jgi:hypothetical protein